MTHFQGLLLIGITSSIMANLFIIAQILRDIKYLLQLQ